MLRVYQSKSAAQAKDYFSSELSQGDYYFGAQEIVGQWGGKAADMLGLSGAVTQDAFNQLVDNINPQTEERLTPHNKGNRRPGYDMTFSAPKSLSVLYEYSKDERLLEAFREAVHTTMQSIEEAMHVRVRKDGMDEDRQTGNLVYGSFEHYTARPVEEMAPDPQLHMHCFVMNASYDEEEQQWKAGQFGEIKRDAPYYEALFHSHLSDSLSKLGMDIEKDGKFWTIDGIERETIEKFSNRTLQIEEYAREQNILNAKAKDFLGAKLRGAKVGEISREALRDVWWDRLDDDERDALDKLSGFDPNDGSDNSALTRFALAENYLDYALKHQLERQSVVPLTRLKETALREGFGQITSEDLEAAIEARDDLIKVPQHGRTFVSTRAVLQQEDDIIQFTQNGYNKLDRLNENYEIGKVTDYEKNTEFELAEEQKAAVNNILTSRDRVTAVQGKAGVGKTTMMATLIDGIEDGGSGAMILAPTADAAYKTLHEDGEKYRNETMKNAQTLARYFVDEKIQDESRGKTLIVDEAGLMSVGDMHALFEIASANDNRIVLVGDTTQHNSVMRGDAYRILQQEARLETLTLENIRRQDGDYKRAVSAISKGNVVKGFDKLDKLEAITEESDDEERYRKLGDSYANYVDAGESTLAVAPTHAEGKRATEAIREELKERGHIKNEEHITTRHRNLQLTEAERGSRHNFKAGQMIRYQQNAKGSITRGSQFSVSKVDKKHVWITDKNGNESKLDLTQSQHFNVYEKQSIALAKGEAIRITEGGKSKDGKRLDNGAIYKVDKVLGNGDVKLSNGRVLDAEQGNINYGYVSTSYASQGRTVNHVLIAQSTESGGASSAEQFYVSVSRGKKSVEIFTDNKEELREQIQRSHQRLSATELIKNQPDTDKANKEHAEFIASRMEMVRQGILMPNLRPPPVPNNDSWQDKARQQPDRGLSRD